MADKKTKNVRFVSPKGIASYPHLNKPDDFKGERAYKAKLVVDRDDAAKFIDLAEETLKAFIEDFNAAGPKKKINPKKALLNVPFEDHPEDDEKVILKFKQNAEINGDTVKLAYYDAKGKPVKKAPLIRGGSTVKIAGTLRPYDGLGGGITASIYAVQIIELSEGMGASDPGFGEEEGTFDANEAEPEGFSDETDDEFEGYEGNDEEDEFDEDGDGDF